MLHHGYTIAVLCMVTPSSRVAIVTGGTRGIGRGIAESLAASGFDLLLTYNTNGEQAERTSDHLREMYGCTVILCRGDLTLPETRRSIFHTFDTRFANTHTLRAMIHNAGQYVGITADNVDGLAADRALGFGCDSPWNATEHAARFDVMRYYQRLYGEAFVDLCERSITRMSDGGSLIGISSPGCTLQYKPNLGYDMPGSGKCVMEFTMRLYALRCASRGINCNVVIPGVTATDAWHHIATRRETSASQMITALASKIAPMGAMAPREVGDVVSFLCSNDARFVTGVSLPVDGGVHLRI